MPYTKPATSYAGHSVPLKQNVYLAEPYSDMVLRLAVAAGPVGADRRPRKDAVKANAAAFSVILFNLLRAHYRDPNLFVALPLGNDDYPKGPFNPLGLGIRAIRRAFWYLRVADPPYVEVMGANHNPQTGEGYYTRVRATKRLIDELEEYLAVATGPSPRPSLTGNVLFKDPQSPSNIGYFRSAQLPIIRLKADNDDEDHGGNQFLPLPDTEEVKAMVSRLTTFNAFLSDHWIDLLIPDSEFLALQHRSRGDPDRYFRDKGRPIELDFVSARRLHRVFNNGRLTHGGRFYGGWWQNIPSKYRRAITINWHLTAEVDYSSLHPHMLYALEGKEPPREAYALPGFPEEHRDLLKTTFQKLINATGRIRAPMKEALPEGWTWEQILAGMRELHEPISGYFQTGKGIELQRLDSDIAEKVMLRMMGMGFVALPVHDSFIVWDNKADLLTDVMKEAYAEVMGHHIRVKPDTRWIDENLTADDRELHEYGVRHIEDATAAWSDGPEFAQYRRRHHDWMGMVPEAWGHRHSFNRLSR